MSSEIQSLRLEIDALKRKSIPNCEGLEAEYTNAQQKADAAYRAVGHDGSPPHLMGESLIDYRHRLLRGVQDKSPAWKKPACPVMKG